ncbi:MAG TPA: hypothetical protein VGL11_08885 [Candidatus Binatia bacterium]
MRSPFASRLEQALRKKESVEAFVTNLQRLKDSGSVNPEQYRSMMQGYNRDLAEISKELTELRATIARELETDQIELADQREELGKLDVRLKVGELQQAQFDRAARPIHKRIQVLEENVQLCGRLQAATTAAELAPLTGHSANAPRTAGRFGRPASWLPEREAFTDFVSIEEMTTPRFKALGFFSGILLLVSVLAKWVSSEKWASVSGSDISAWLLIIGLLGAAGAIYGSLLAQPKVRGFLHLVVAGLGIVVLLAAGSTLRAETVQIDLGGMNLRMPGGAVTYRSGFYLYLISLALMIYYGLSEYNSED